jgi:hypothetical protein
MKYGNAHPRAGFLALTSVLILFAFMLVLTTGIALTSFIARGTASRSYYKEVSRALAESCIEEALLRLAATSTYAGSEVLSVATNSIPADACTIGSIAASSSNLLIQATSSFQNAATNIRATVRASDLVIIGWEELKSF